MGVNLKAFLLLLDELALAGLVILVLWVVGVEIPFWVFIILAVLCGALFLLLRRILLDGQKKPRGGREAMIGLTGQCVTHLDPEGLIRVKGETWKAVSICGVVDRGTEVVVEDLKGLKLVVKTEGE